MLRHWSPLAQETGLIIQEFDEGMELRAPGYDQGVALRAVLTELGPTGLAVYLAQDLSAEDVFRAVQPPGIGVLVRDEFRTTAADLWLQPSSLSIFLTRWHRSSQPEGIS
jgi:trehalose-6-phosphatase